jgi:hypothetical protein
MYIVEVLSPTVHTSHTFCAFFIDVTGQYIVPRVRKGPCIDLQFV